MTYNKTNWVDGVTPVSAQNMNKLETQYEKAKADLDTHKAETASDGVHGLETPKVLQVKTAVSSVLDSTNSSTFVDTSLTASITPKLSNSKIIVLVNGITYGEDTSRVAHWETRVIENGGMIVCMCSYSVENYSSAANYFPIGLGGIFINTNKNTKTFQLQIRRVSGNNAHIKGDMAPVSMIVLEVEA